MAPDEERPDVPENPSSDPLDAPYPDDPKLTELGKVFAWANDRSESRLAQTLAEVAKRKANKDKPPVQAADADAVAALEELRAEIGQNEQGEVVEVNLNGTQITDGGLVHLKGLTDLQALNLGCTKITDAGLVHLKGLTGLQELGLSNTQITDAGLVHLKGLTELQTLYLDIIRITDTGLVHLKGLATLQMLFFRQTQITDAGLVHLKGLVNLLSLYLHKTQVTDTGVADLQKALPNCEISK